MGRAALSLMSARLLALGSGFAFSIVLAHRFGASGEADVFFLALFLPNALAALFLAQVPAALIPAYTAAGADRRGLLRAALHLATALAGGLVLAGALLSDPLAAWLAPGFNAAQREQASTFLAVLMAIVLVAAIVGALRGMLNAEGVFFITEFEKLVGHAVAIGIVLIGAARWGIAAAVWGVVAAGVARVLVVALPARRFVRGPTGSPRPALRGFAGAFVLLVVCELFHHVNHGVGRALATQIGESAVSYLSYADRVAALAPYLVFGAVGWAMAPRLSRLAAAGQREAFAQTAFSGLRLSLLIGLPMAVFLIAAAEPLTILIFVRGEFTLQDARACAPVLQAYAPGLVGAGGFILLQAFVALRKLGRLIPVFAVGAVANFLMARAWIPALGTAGIALAFAVTTAGCFAVGLFVLRRLIGGRPGNFGLVKIGIATILCALAAADPFELLKGAAPLLQLGAKGAALVAVYGAALRAMRSEDLRFLLAKVRELRGNSRRMGRGAG